jgi:hypothetical protein
MVNRRHAGGLALVCALVRQIDMSRDGKTSRRGHDRAESKAPLHLVPPSPPRPASCSGWKPRATPQVGGTIAEHETLALSERDRTAFFDTLSVL